MKTIEAIYEEAQALMKKAVWRMGKIREMKTRVHHSGNHEGVADKNGKRAEHDAKVKGQINRLEYLRNDLKLSLKLLKDYLNETQLD